MAMQKWEYCSLTIDHYPNDDSKQEVTFILYTLAGNEQEVILSEKFGQFLAQLGREGWELAGVSCDQPPPSGARYRESWVFKRPLKDRH